MTVEDEGIEPSFENDEDGNIKLTTTKKTKKLKIATNSSKMDVEKKPSKKKRSFANNPDDSDALPAKISKIGKSASEDTGGKQKRKRTRNTKMKGFLAHKECDVNSKKEGSKQKKKKDSISGAATSEDSLKNSDENPDKSVEDKKVLKEEKFNYNPLLNRLRGISEEEKVKEMIDVEIAAGLLGPKDIGNIIRKWRQMKSRKITLKADLAQLNQFEGTLEEFKGQINKLVKEGQMTRFEAGTVIKKWKVRETRRVSRQVEKRSGKLCLKCRQPGHKMGECSMSGNEADANICFKCGSLEHAIYKCPRKDKVKGFPYASCFVCKKQGHLSRDCDRNEKGIYPDGGCCNICRSNQHLVKDCPEKFGKSKEDAGELVVKNTISRGGDDDDFEFETENDEKKKEALSSDDTTNVVHKKLPKKISSKVKKIVKF